MLAAVLIVSLLIFKGYSTGMDRGYSSGLDDNPGQIEASGSAEFRPVQRAIDVNPLIEETAQAQRKALEQQLQ